MEIQGQKFVSLKNCGELLPKYQSKPRYKQLFFLNNHSDLIERSVVRDFNVILCILKVDLALFDLSKILDEANLILIN